MKINKFTLPVPIMINYSLDQIYIRVYIIINLEYSKYGRKIELLKYIPSSRKLAWGGSFTLSLVKYGFPKPHKEMQLEAIANIIY